MIKFLVSSDEEGVSVQLRKLLENRGYTAFAASDSAQAVVIAQREQPSIAILDIHAHNLSGMDLLRALKHISAKTRVIILAAYDDEAMRTMAAGLGSSAYLIKPYNFDDIAKTIRKLIHEILEEEGQG